MFPAAYPGSLDLSCRHALSMAAKEFNWFASVSSGEAFCDGAENQALLTIANVLF